MSKRLQTSFSQRSSAKGRITRIANRFMAIGGETDARESVITLRNDMNAALQKFVEIDEQFIRELNAEEESEHPITSRTAAEYVADADEYLIKAEEMLFEASRYMDRRVVAPIIHATTSTSAGKGSRILFRALTHDDCELWFVQLEDVFATQGVDSQVAKFAALTTLITEEEAYVIRDLTMMGDARPTNVFDEAKRKFSQRYQLTVDQRLTRALAMGGIGADEKPSQWMARFRHTGGDWSREDVERWALLRRLPSSLRTTLELPTPQLSIEDLLIKADSLYATLPSAIVSAIDDIPPELTAAVYAGDVPAVNVLLVKRSVRRGVDPKRENVKYGNSSGGKNRIAQRCWYHTKFGDDARCCNGPPCVQFNPQLPKGRNSSENFKGSQ